MLPPDQVERIKAALRRGRPQRDVAREEGVGHTTVGLIATGKRTTGKRRRGAAAVESIPQGPYREVPPTRCACGALVVLLHKRSGRCVACEARARQRRKRRR